MPSRWSEMANLEFQSDERLAGATNTGFSGRWKVFNSMILDEGTEKEFERTG